MLFCRSVRQSIGRSTSWWAQLGRWSRSSISPFALLGSWSKRKQRNELCIEIHLQNKDKCTIMWYLYGSGLDRIRSSHHCLLHCGFNWVYYFNADYTIEHWVSALNLPPRLRNYTFWAYSDLVRFCQDHSYGQLANCLLSVLNWSGFQILTQSEFWWSAGMMHDLRNLLPQTTWNIPLQQHKNNHKITLEGKPVPDMWTNNHDIRRLAQSCDCQVQCQTPLTQAISFTVSSPAGRFTFHAHRLNANFRGNTYTQKNKLRIERVFVSHIPSVAATDPEGSGANTIGLSQKGQYEVWAWTSSCSLAKWWAPSGA